jgi:general secretion pathway protein I
VSLNRRDKWNKGFTLIEMLVALAVVAIALSALSSNYISYFDTTSRLKENTLARWIAENRLVQAQIETPWPVLGTKQGSLKYAGSEWQWEQVVRPSPDRDFRQIKIQVGKKPSAGKALSPVFQLVGYAHNPGPGRKPAA